MEYGWPSHSRLAAAIAIFGHRSYYKNRVSSDRGVITRISELSTGNLGGKQEIEVTDK